MIRAALFDLGGVIFTSPFDASRDMGMATIKVVDPARAIDELEHVVGFPLRAGS